MRTVGRVLPYAGDRREREPSIASGSITRSPAV